MIDNDQYPSNDKGHQCYQYDTSPYDNAEYRGETTLTDMRTRKFCHEGITDSHVRNTVIGSHLLTILFPHLLVFLTSIDISLDDHASKEQSHQYDK